MADTKDKSTLDSDILAITRDRKSYQSNSHSSKEKKVEKVIDGEVKTRKQPLSKKIQDTFLSDDVEDVKGYLFFDVLIPNAKKTIQELIESGTNMMLWGSANRNQKSKSPYRSYDKESQKARIKETSTRRTIKDYRELIFETRSQAEEVLSNMSDLIVDYGEVNIADLKDLAGITSDFTDNKYGWVDLRGAKVVMVKDGYIIDLPRPILLT